MRRLISCLTLALLLGSTCFLYAANGQTSEDPEITALRADRMLDIESGRVIEDPVVIIRGDEIKAAAAGVPVPDGAGVIDLGDMILLPGLIDAHTHLLENYEAGVSESVNMVATVTMMTPARRALLGVAMGREVLEAGVTTVREVGNSGWNGDVALRDAIEAGWVAGPRIFASTRALADVGGQFFGGLAPYAQDLVQQEYAVINGPVDARRAVRQAVFDGADLIKVIVNTPPRVLTLEEMEAIVDEANRMGKRVAAHATSPAATVIAAKAGVNSIEHGYRISDAALEIMAEEGIYLVPTHYPAEFYMALSGPLSPEERQIRLERVRQSAEQGGERLMHAIDMGVPIAFGSDEYYDVPGYSRGEASLLALQAYQEAGMSPLDVIRAATVNAADLLGMSDRLGTIEAGKLADIIAVDGRPLEDVSDLQQVRFVMKDGEVFRNDLGSLSAQADFEFGIDTAGFDWSVRPQDDFFQFVNGGWLKRTDIPEGLSRYGARWKLWDEIQQSLKTTLENMAASTDAGPEPARMKLADFYESYMDTLRIDMLGLEPVREELDAIDALKERRELASLFAHLRRIGVEVPVYLSVGRNPENSDAYAAVVGPSGTGLPGPRYYLRDEERFEDIRSAYLDYIERLLHLIGHAAAADAAGNILRLERTLAEHQADRGNDADATGAGITGATDEELSVAALEKFAPGFAWGTFLSELGLDRKAEVILRRPAYLRSLGGIIYEIPLDTWRAYLKFRLLERVAPVLDHRFANAHSAFMNRLYGSSEHNPRWKRAVLATGAAFTDVLGRAYVERHFRTEAIARTEAIVSNVREAFRRGIDDLEWADRATKRRVREKLAAIEVRIGFPQRRIDYSDLRIRSGDLVGNVLRLEAFEHRRMMAHLGRPVEPEDLIFPAYVPDAFAVRNQIIFPAAGLQPPYFHPDAPDAVNYGAIGTTIGHEISHHFDYGSLRGDALTMTAAGSAAFEALVDKLAQQFSRYNPIDTLYIDGRLTLDENMADLNGLAASYRAYRLSLEGEEAPVVAGFTGAPRFFLGFAQAARIKIREEKLRSMLRGNPHAPPRYRVNGVLRNVPAFYRAFNVEPGDGMYLPPEERVEIWSSTSAGVR